MYICSILLPSVQKVAIYARMSSAEHRTNLERRAERLTHYCEVKGYQVTQIVKEIASGVNDSRPKLLSLLKDGSITVAKRLNYPTMQKGMTGYCNPLK
jgi:predicted site-specific integrase-resolvase